MKRSLGFIALLAALMLALPMIQMAQAGGKPKDLGICHNIGGPDGLGANCDGDCVGLDFLAPAEALCGQIEACATDRIYLGIFVPHSDNAIEAHIKHGDGPTLVLIDPDREHGQAHDDANWDCIAYRFESNEQPPEPGN